MNVVIDLKNRDDDLQHFAVDYQKGDDVLLSDLRFVHQVQKFEYESLCPLPNYCVPGLEQPVFNYEIC